MVNLFLLLPFIHQLSWSDYKGIPNYGLISQGYIAHTETKWVMKDSVDENGKTYWESECRFVPEESWTTTDSRLTLRHENTHYQISVLWHNKWIQTLKKYQGCPEAKRQKVINLFNHYWKEYRKLQELFDKETKNSRVRIIEEQWEENINKELCKSSN